MRTAVLTLACAASLSACAPVRPWQRGALARPSMTMTLTTGSASGDAIARGYRAKVLESKTGGGLPGSAPGGGCGCTQ